MRRGTGLGLALLLIVALIVAYLAVRQTGSVQEAGTTDGDGQSALQQAQDVADALDRRTEEVLGQLGDLP